MLQSVVTWFYKALEAILVFCMVVMFVLVFANVVMRFGFNSGIDISEEVPRFMFVWMTFFGAVVAMRERTHIGVNIILMTLPKLGRKVCYALCQILILICCGYMLYSTHLQWEIIYYNLSPVLQVSMFFVFGVSYIAAPVIGLNVIANLVRLARGRVSDAELIQQPDDAEQFLESHAGMKPEEGARS